MPCGQGQELVPFQEAVHLAKQGHPVLWGEEEGEGLRARGRWEGHCPRMPAGARSKARGGAVQAEVREGTSILRVSSVWGMDKTPLEL